VATAAFEDWPLPPAWFDAVMAATSFHWLDPEVRLAKAARALAPLRARHRVLHRRAPRAALHVLGPPRARGAAAARVRAEQLEVRLRRGLLDCIRELIDGRFGGRVVKRSLTELAVEFLPSGAGAGAA
jgi:hypothetical protein